MILMKLNSISKMPLRSQICSSVTPRLNRVGRYQKMGLVIDSSWELFGVLRRYLDILAISKRFCVINELKSAIN